MKNKKLGYIILFIFLFSFVPFTGGISTIDTTPSDWYEDARSIKFNQRLDQSINTYELDKNYNKIADDLDISTNSMEEVIVIFDSFSSVPNAQLFEGFVIENVLKTAPAIKITVPTSYLDILSGIDNVKFIERNYKLKTNLFKSTTQFGVRSEVWDLGYTGSSDQSIAIVDSGIDTSHIAFQDRIIANMNAISGEFPVDDVGHGTHVAGIAAGNMDLTPENDVKATSRGKLGSECTSQGCYYSFDHQLKNIGSGNSDVTITLDWANKGQDNPNTMVQLVIADSSFNLACQTCIVEESDGLIQQTFSLPVGDYIVAVTNVNNAAGQNYEMAITYPVDSQLSLNDGYPKAAGVAHTTNLVNVKVVDALGNGDATTFDTAMDWIIQHKNDFNISVVNLSIGINAVSTVIDSSIGQLADNGIVAVVAAGNEGANAGGVYSPGSAPEAITVGAVNSANELTFYSSKGSASANGAIIKPDVLAPGGSSAAPLLGFETRMPVGFGRIMSADASIGFDLQSDDLIGQEGTSMASPHVAGLASLMIQYFVDNNEWSGTKADVFKLKRMILSNTFEVANIGYGRTYSPNFPQFPNVDPTLDRVNKDYNEGWGAVDAASAFKLIGNQLNLGDTKNFQISMDAIDTRHVYSWRLTAQPGTNYGIKLDVPSGFDADLLLIPLDSGPQLNGKDYGELLITKSSTGGMGSDESIGFNVNQETEYIVVVKAVDGGSSLASLQLSVIQVDSLPSVDITSPINGAILSNNDVEIIFSSTTGSAALYFDQNYISNIQSGYIIEGVSDGQHRVRLTENIDGISDEAVVTFEVKYREDTDKNNINTLPSWIIIPALITGVIIRRKRRLYQ